MEPNTPGRRDLARGSFGVQSYVSPSESARRKALSALNPPHIKQALVHATSTLTIRDAKRAGAAEDLETVEDFEVPSQDQHQDQDVQGNPRLANSSLTLSRPTRVWLPNTP